MRRPQIQLQKRNICGLIHTFHVCDVRSTICKCNSDFLRVDISCDAPVGRSRAIRYSAHPRVVQNSVVAELARRAEEGQFSVDWTVEWHRLDHIPGNIPIMSLNLATDTHANLIVLERVLSTDDVQVEIPDFVPASWGS